MRYLITDLTFRLDLLIKVLFRGSIIDYLGEENALVVVILGLLFCELGIKEVY